MPAFTRLHKATAIVPLALLSAAWSVSMASAGASSAADEEQGLLPDGTAVPTQAIEAPASVSAPPGSTPAAASGDTGRIIATASTSGIPTAALAAYQRAEAVINSADKSCELPWQLIAAIGRVESDHGRFAGNTLDDDGVAQPGIYGIPLNGKNNTQRITDTDAGQHDSDVKFDRAVGPMQFIPSTWSVVGVDGDNDGKRNPQDIDDAALATAVYLCSGDDDLSSDKGQRASVYRYNHSNDYVDLVLSIMEAYLQGDFTSVPNGTTSAGVFAPDPAGPRISTARTNAKGGKSGSGGTAVVRGGGGSTTTKTTQPTTTASATSTPAPAPTQTATQAPTKVPLKLPTKLPSTTLTPLPTTGVSPVDETLTLTQALAQCTTQGVVDDLLTATNELTDCANALLAP
ncbi:lytic transglycosylase domain-containing protein [Nocardioides piscis]|uniref:Lytic transglycosylase domain-containing protein n=1 Tax=Nocardioides piscis TaxID=2714938 RepID=A0A6G7YCI0_9ACTN|nr:lytic transglycosylase domain-containing protein [Nocardioides piscis]QIK74503.1 lytic transglycosylase domain-containing protein [Nocardioides piscis]